MVEVEPSLYAADFGRLNDQLEALLNAGARVFHFDVGDGHFVEPVTIGPIVMQSIFPLIEAGGGVLDVHLMVESPEHHFAAVKAAGGKSVTFHYEACDDPAAVAAQAREHGLAVGLAFNPETEVDAAAAAAVAAGVDLILCMSIHPGYSAQRFMPEALDRIRRARELVPEQMYVQVDGGITNENIRSVYDAGARLIVSGSAIFAMEDLTRAYRRLVAELA